MEAIILLNYNENIKQIEQEEKFRYLRSLLEQMGVPIQDFWVDDSPLSVSQRIKLQEVLSAFDIQIIDDLDGQMQVYVKEEEVASWYKPSYKLKRDLKERGPRKQLYLEMTIRCNSLFDESAEQEK